MCLIESVDTTVVIPSLLARRLAKVLLPVPLVPANRRMTHRLCSTILQGIADKMQHDVEDIDHIKDEPNQKTPKSHETLSAFEPRLYSKAQDQSQLS